MRSKKIHFDKFTPHPWTPIVTIDEFLACHPDKPETKTASLLVNAVAEAFWRVKPVSGINVARYLNLDINKLSIALEVIIGMDYKKLHDVWLRKRYEENKKRHPEWGSDEIARFLGYSDRSALWRLHHREMAKKDYREFKERPRKY